LLPCRPSYTACSQDPNYIKKVKSKKLLEVEPEDYTGKILYRAERSITWVADPDTPRIQAVASVVLQALAYVTHWMLKNMAQRTATTIK